MKNKMLFILNSVKQSVINKPFAFVLLILIFFATTICCSLPSRYLVACLNFVRSEPNSMFFEVSPDYFKQNNVKIGDYIRNNCNNLAFEDKNIESDFFVRHYESSIIFNDKAIKFKEMRVRFVVKQSFGITDEDIRENPRILSTPALDIKDKYALWCSIFPDKRFMKLRTWFMTRVEKIYARYVYLAEDLHKTDIRPNQLDFSEKNFVSRFKMSSDTLMERYPLDETILTDFYEKYNSLGIQPPIVQDKGEAFGK